MNGATSDISQWEHIFCEVSVTTISIDLLAFLCLSIMMEHTFKSHKVNFSWKKITGQRALEVGIVTWSCLVRWLIYSLFLIHRWQRKNVIGFIKNKIFCQSFVYHWYGHPESNSMLLWKRHLYSHDCDQYIVLNWTDCNQDP